MQAYAVVKEQPFRKALKARVPKSQEGDQGEEQVLYYMGYWGRFLSKMGGKTKGEKNSHFVQGLWHGDCLRGGKPAGRRETRIGLIGRISIPWSDPWLIIDGQGHTALSNVECFSGHNGALTTLGQSQDFLLVRGDRRLTVSLFGARMRNYAAADPITCTNPNALVRAVACVDKDERPYDRTIPT